MKIQAFLLLLICITFSCKQKVANEKSLEPTNNSTEKNNAIVKMQQNNQKPYFIASGTEPFWGVEIFKDSIIFKTPEESIKTPHVKPILAMDANVKLYKISTENHQLNMQIIQKSCTNNMSGEAFPYAVSISIKTTADKDFKEMEGCGQYVTDYRLHDIWLLESLKGKKITKEDFVNEFPTIEINSSDNSFMGFAGCNRVNGNLFFENNLLRFKDVVTTEMMCESSNKELEFLNALQSSTHYSIENNRLTLSNPSETLIVFKKTD